MIGKNGDPGVAAAEKKAEDAQKGLEAAGIGPKADEALKDLKTSSEDSKASERSIEKNEEAKTPLSKGQKMLSDNNPFLENSVDENQRAKRKLLAEPAREDMILIDLINRRKAYEIAPQELLKHFIGLVKPAWMPRLRSISANDVWRALH